MPQDNGLRFGPITSAVHLCVDMQEMFREGTPWSAPWVERILPSVHALSLAHPDRNIFTRFVPPLRPEECGGRWRAYYERWREMTQQRLDPDKMQLIGPLRALVPPGLVFDKPVYSPWLSGELHALLRRRHVSTLVISGAETDVCVLATVMTAIDHGYRTVLALDALCGSADETHDALIKLYQKRFGMQVETASVTEILNAWTDAD